MNYITPKVKKNYGHGTLIRFLEEIVNQEKYISGYYCGLNK